MHYDDLDNFPKIFTIPIDIPQFLWDNRYINPRERKYMQVYADKKPKVSEVTSWTRFFHQSGISVYEADNFYDYYKVVPSNGKARYFFGETAWMKAQRYAVDLIGMSGYNVFRN